MILKSLNQDFTVCKITDLSTIKWSDDFCFVSKTDEEFSLVCYTESTPSNITEKEDGWKAFRIEGVLDFSLVGILAKISNILAENNISIFAISTYNTDYILVKKENYNKALELLKNI